jgi:Tfp pilus assembly protein PilF
MRRRAWTSLVAVSGALVVGGCESPPLMGPQVPAEQPQASNTQPAQPALQGPIAVPPGIDPEAVKPLSGQALSQARASLATILKKSPVPDYLKSPATQASPAPADANDQTIPLQAQKAYAHARQLIRQEHWGEAINRLKKARRLAPKTPQILTRLGEAWLASGNTIKAGALLEQALQLNPDHGQSLMLLGRFAMGRQRWVRATPFLHRALQVAQRDTHQDPALAPLSRYYLAICLRNRDYAAASLAQFRKYLDQPRLSRRPTWLGQQLALTDRRRGRTWQLVGDLHLQLDQPPKAIEAYRAAAEHGTTQPLKLHKRRVYALLRAGRANAAVTRVAQWLKRDNTQNEPAFKLAGYLKSQGVNVAPLTRQLRQLYAQSRRDPALARAVAELLPDDQATALLEAHLSARPGDDKVFAALLDRFGLNAEPSENANVTAAALQKAVRITAQRMHAKSNEANATADMLLDRLGPSALKQLTRATLIEKTLAQSDQASGVSSAAYTLAGLAAQRDDDAKKARRLFERAMQVDAPLGLARVALARLQYQAGDLAAAQQTLAPLPLRANRSEVQLRLNILTDLQKPEQARQLVNDLIQQNRPAPPWLLIAHARLLADQGAVAQATQQLEQAIEKRPKAEPLYGALLELYLSSGKGENRFEKYRDLRGKLLRRIPEARLSLIFRARARLQRNQNDRALMLLERARNKYPENATVVATLMQTHQQLNQPNQALKLGRAALKKPLDEPAAVAQRAWLLLLAQNKADAAVKLVKAAIERHRDHAKTLRSQLALLYQYLGRDAQSEEVMLAMLERYPTHTRTMNGLAYFWAQRGKNLDRALKLSQKAVEAEPERYAYLDTLGWVHYKRGNLEAALQQLTKARQQAKAQGATADPVILDHLGDTYYRLGQPERAATAWSRARTALNERPKQPVPDPDTKHLDQRLEAKLAARNGPDTPPVAPSPALDEPSARTQPEPATQTAP